MSGVCTKHEDCRNNPELGATCYARTPRAYTPEEVRDRLLDHLWVMVDYWEREERAPTARDKITGFMHSTLAALDGCSMALPGFPCSSASAVSWRSAGDGAGGELGLALSNVKVETLFELLTQ